MRTATSTLWLALAGFLGLVLGFECGQAFTTLPPSYRVTSPVTYECGHPELAEAVANWAAASPYIEDGGCTPGSAQLRLDYLPNAIWDTLPSVMLGYHNCHAISGGLIECRASIQAQESAGAVMTHEVGHQLGLGHSADPASIMNAAPCEKPDRNTYVNCNGISEDDVAGLTYLYGPQPATATPTATQTRPPSPTATLTPTQSAVPTRTVTPTPVSHETPAPTVIPTPRAPRYHVVVGEVARYR